MTCCLFSDKRIFFFWEPVYNWQGIRKDNDLFLTTEVIIILSWAKLLGQNKLVSHTLICYIGHAKRTLHCPWDTPKTAQEYLSKPPCSPDWEVCPVTWKEMIILHFHQELVLDCKCYFSIRYLIFKGYLSLIKGEPDS